MSTPFPKSPLDEIKRIDSLLDLNREMLLDAERAPESEARSDKIIKMKGRINTLLDERWGWMQARDKVAA